MGSSTPSYPEGKTTSAKMSNASQQAKDHQFTKGKVNVEMNEKRKSEQQNKNPPSSSNTPPTTQATSHESFRLENVIPAPSETQLASSIEEWRGLRRPKNKPSSETFRWEDKKDWGGWSD